MRRGHNQFEPSQPDKRRFSRWRDQHGREWEGVVDITNGFPIGPLKLTGKEPPLIPEQQYFIFPLLHDGTFTINYRQWIQDREKAKKVHESRRIKYARKMYGEQAGIMLKKNPPELQHAVGDEPEAVEPVLAASSGNKWVLGLSDQKPEWANDFSWGARQYAGQHDDEPEDWNTERLNALFPDADAEQPANQEV